MLTTSGLLRLRLVDADEVRKTQGLRNREVGVIILDAERAETQRSEGELQ